MAFTYIRVTRTYELATDVPATGSVRFRPVDRMVNGLTVVSSPVTAVLDGAGSIDVRLAATTDPATRPIGVTYEVREQITGQTPVVYYVSVPHTAPSGTVDLSTLSVISPADIGAFAIRAASDYDNTTPPAGGNAIVWNATTSKWKPGAVAGGTGGVQTVNGEFPDGAGNLVLSASDVGAQPADADLTGLGNLGDGYPQRAAGTWNALSASQLQTNLGVINQTPVTLTASGGVITPNASSGWLFRHTAAANVTLATPTGGADGQLISVEVLASGADRVLTLPAGTSPATVTITSGTWLQVDLRSHGGGTWIVVDYYPVSAGAGSSIPADGSVTNVKVATNAAISADKLVDGTANKILTSAERTKLAVLNTGTTQVSVDGVAIDTLNINSAAVVASDVGAMPNSGTSVLTGILQVQDAGPTKGYRLRTSGGSLDLEACGAQVFLSNWSGADFTGTQRYYMVIENGAQVLQLIDQIQFRATPNGTTGHTINGATGVASLGSKNGLTNLSFCGFKSTTGAPTTGTWAVGDLVMDSAKVWWRCSVAGTPGTWV